MAAVVGGPLAMWLYVGSVLVAAALIFVALRGWLMKHMDRYLNWVWGSVKR